MRALLLFIVACHDEPQAPPAPPPPPHKTVVAPLPPARAPSGVPTCDPPWRDKTTTLDALQADAKGATICVTAKDVRDCVHYDVDTHAFTNTELIPAATPPPPPRLPPGLGISPAELDEIEQRGLAMDVAPDGKHFVVPLPLEGVAAVFDTATRQRTGVLKIVRFEANCIGPAFFLGNNAVFAGAHPCDLTNHLGSWHMLTAVDGYHEFAVPEMDMATRAQIAPHEWVATSLKTHAIMVVDDREPEVVRVTELAKVHSMVYGELAIGALQAPPTVALGTDGRLFSVGNRAVAVVPPPSKEYRGDPVRLGNGALPAYIAFPKCPVP